MSLSAVPRRYGFLVVRLSPHTHTPQARMAVFPSLFVAPFPDAHADAAVIRDSDVFMHSAVSSLQY